MPLNPFAPRLRPLTPRHASPRIMPAGTPLADIPPEFEGMPEFEYRMLKAFEGKPEPASVSRLAQKPKFGKKPQFKYE